MDNRCSLCGKVEEYKDVCGNKNQHFLCNDCKVDYNYYKVRTTNTNACLCCNWLIVNDVSNFTVNNVPTS